jgi:hypothetical protein
MLSWAGGSFDPTEWHTASSTECFHDPWTAVLLGSGHSSGSGGRRVSFARRGT